MPCSPSKPRSHLADAYAAAASGVRPFAALWMSAYGDVLRSPELGALCRDVERGAPAASVLKHLLQLPLEPGADVLVPGYETVFQSVQRIEKRRRTVPTVRVNPRTLEWAREQSGKLIRGIGSDARNSIRGIIARRLAAGQRAESMVDQIRRHVGLLPHQSAAVERRVALLEEQGESSTRVREMSRQYADQLLFRRALTIARTETTAAQNQGLLDTWLGARDAGELPDQVVRVWVSAPESPNPNKPCQICLSLDGLEAGLDDPFESDLLPEPVMRPPAHTSCLPGDSLVVAGATASTERWYEGDLVIIRTSEGHRLACTPNHPVLTPFGWAQASALHVGSDVLCCGLGNRVPALFNPDHENVPTMIEQVARALDEQCSSSSRPVPVAAEDFHGDGRGSEVAVVRTNGLLRDDINAQFAEHLGEEFLVWGGVPDALSRKGTTLDVLDGVVLPTSRRMGCLCYAHSLLGGETGHAQRVGSTPATRHHASLEQPGSDAGASDTEGFAQRLLGFSSQVASHKIVNIDVQSFRGHVFNLQTHSGAYVAQGIVTHNCRCTMTLRRGRAGKE